MPHEVDLVQILRKPTVGHGFQEVTEDAIVIQTIGNGSQSAGSMLPFGISYAAENLRVHARYLDRSGQGDSLDQMLYGYSVADKSGTTVEYKRLRKPFKGLIELFQMVAGDNTRDVHGDR